MNKYVKKSLYLCAAALMLGGVVVPSASNSISASAHSRNAVNRYHHKKNVHKYYLRLEAKNKRNMVNHEKALNRYNHLIRVHKHNRKLVKKLMYKRKVMEKKQWSDKLLAHKYRKGYGVHFNHYKKLSNKKRKHRGHKVQKNTAKRSTLAKRHAKLAYKYGYKDGERDNPSNYFKYYKLFHMNGGKYFTDYYRGIQAGSTERNSFGVDHKLSNSSKKRLSKRIKHYDNYLSAYNAARGNKKSVQKALEQDAEVLGWWGNDNNITKGLENGSRAHNNKGRVVIPKLIMPGNKGKVVNPRLINNNNNNQVVRPKVIDGNDNINGQIVKPKVINNNVNNKNVKPAIITKHPNYDMNNNNNFVAYYNDDDSSNNNYNGWGNWYNEHFHGHFGPHNLGATAPTSHYAVARSAINVNAHTANQKPNVNNH